jgi:tRNA-binding EMAP/Myf-like protein
MHRRYGLSSEDFAEPVHCRAVSDHIDSLHNYESQEKKMSLWNKIIVGRVISVEAHEYNEDVKVCRINCGYRTLVILTEAKNISQDMLVAVAEAGAKVSVDGGEQLEVVNNFYTDGIVSDGILCKADQLWLRDRFPVEKNGEIINLSLVRDAAPGVILADLLK